MPPLCVCGERDSASMCTSKLLAMHFSKVMLVLKWTHDIMN